MHRKIITLFFLCLFSVWTVHAQRTGPATMDEIIEKLISSDYRTALDGLVDYMRLSEDQRIPAVKSA
ncbi:MAG: hypothetical protein OXF08_00780, partial [Bacteroidetes bacterium]|nr:hypothetical protein [Bacteroidota bacterium]